MSATFNITDKERSYLRGLATRVGEYAEEPIMSQRRQRWHQHNALEGDRPLLVMEIDTFINDILPPLSCQSEAARSVEFELLRATVNHEMIDDDKVISRDYLVPWQINNKFFNIEIEMQQATADTTGHTTGYRWEHPISDLATTDLSKFEPSTYTVDREATMRHKAFVDDLLGDILSVQLANTSLRWCFTPTRQIIELMGMEAMMFAMMDEPDAFKELMSMISDDMLRYLQWQEDEGLLTLNNGNDYAGAGSYGFTNELPTAESAKTGKIRAQDLWVNMNSQESVGISPEMYKEFIYPHYHKIAERFGLVYYGCCEGVNDIWQECLCKLPKLRKVSISPWCDEVFMGNALRESNVIYSRKPSPNYIGVGRDLDEAAFAKHIETTLNAAKGCQAEIIFRDIYNLEGNRTKPGRAIKIARELIDTHW